MAGGTSNIGYGTVQRFARKGARVVLSDLPQSNGEQMAKELGDNVHFIPADVSNEQDVKNLLNEIDNKFKGLHIVVNCAGFTDRKQFPIYNFAENRPAPLEDFEKVLKVSHNHILCFRFSTKFFFFQSNVTGTYNLARLSVGLIKRNELDGNNLRGIIINTVGLEGLRAHEGQVANAAASGAIITMTKHLAKDFSAEGIRVVAIAPAFMKSSEEKGAGGGHPDEYAFAVQTVVLNSMVNATTIELSGGLDLLQMKG